MANQNFIKDLQLKLNILQSENIHLRGKLAELEANAKAAMALKAEHLKALGVISYAVDDNFQPLGCMGAIKQITGYSENDFLSGKTQWEQLIHPEDLPAFYDNRQSLLDTRLARTIEYRIISGEGMIFWLKDMAVLSENDSGQLITIEGLLIDVTRQKTVEEELLERQAHLDSILNSVQDVIWSVSPDSFELLYISPSAEKVYGCPREELYADAVNGYKLLKTSHEIILDNFSTLLHQGWFETEFCIEQPGRQKRWLNRRAHFAHDAHGTIARIDGVDTDITRRKQAEDSLRYISMHDFLTGLCNRFYFEKEMLAVDNDSLDSVGLIVCDIDGLKTINDNLGHDAGDNLLKRCSEVLKACFRQDEVVSRIGGDEFTILIRNCTMPRLEEAVERLRQTIAQHNQSGHAYPLSLSVGYALKSSPELRMRDIFREADNLMYAEKPEKRRSFHKLYRSLKI